MSIASSILAKFFIAEDNSMQMEIKTPFRQNYIIEGKKLCRGRKSKDKVMVLVSINMISERIILDLFWLNIAKPA